MNKANFVRTWFVISTIFTCNVAGRLVGDYFFYGSEVPWLIGAFAAIAIGWYSADKLKSIV